MKMQSLSLILLGFSFAVVAYAVEEEATGVTNKLTIERGKLVGEEHEIEIYDYHSGVYQTVTVFRKPKSQSDAAVSTPDSGSAADRKSLK